MKHEARYTASFEMEAPEGVTVYAGSAYLGTPTRVTVVATSDLSPEAAQGKAMSFVARLVQAASR